MGVIVKDIVMTEREKELLRREMWTWIGSACSCSYLIISALIERACYSVNASVLPAAINKFLIEHGYFVLKVNGDGFLYSCIWSVLGLIVFYLLCCTAIKHGGLECFKGVFRGAVIWGGLVGGVISFILCKEMWGL